MSEARQMSEAELRRHLRGKAGPNCDRQAQVLAWMAEHRPPGDGPWMPNLAECAREVGISRQVVSAALKQLVRKGFAQVTEKRELFRIERTRIVRQLTLSLPGQDQLDLPFGNGGPCDAASVQFCDAR